MSTATALFDKTKKPHTTQLQPKQTQQTHKQRQHECVRLFSFEREDSPGEQHEGGQGERDRNENAHLQVTLAPVSATAKQGGAKSASRIVRTTTQE